MARLTYSICPRWEALPLHTRRSILNALRAVWKLEMLGSVKSLVDWFGSEYGLNAIALTMIAAESSRPGTVYAAFATDWTRIDSDDAGGCIVVHGTSYEDAANHALDIYRATKAHECPRVHALLLRCRDYLLGDYSDPDSLGLMVLEAAPDGSAEMHYARGC